MAINLNYPDYLYLKSRIREDPRDFVALVGAGLSVPCGLPTWPGLKDLLVENALQRASDYPEEEQSAYIAKLMRISGGKNLWHAFSDLKATMHQLNYEKGIKERLTLTDKNKIPETYDLLWKLQIKGILTYNIDTCAIDSFAKVNKSAVDCATGKDISRYAHFLGGPQSFVFQPHGIVSDSSTWVFTNVERQELLNNQSYISFMKSLCQSKHLLILGFDPSDFAFEYVFQSAFFDCRGTGIDHYILIPNADPTMMSGLRDKGLSVITYSPDDPKLHNEIKITLEDMLSFVPEDTIPPTVFTGPEISPSKLPEVSDLIGMPLEKMRELLNGAISSIIPPEKEPRMEDIETLEKFYKDNMKPIHLAWLVESNSEFDVLHGYRIQGTRGRGAFGQVFEASNVKSGERAAVKLLLPEIRNKRDYLNSFRRGVRSMRILTQRKAKGMVKFKEAFEIPACVFMEYVDGPTLEEAMEHRLLDSLPKCLDILVRVGTIVHNAHNLEERVLHRDLKPANVILRNYYKMDDPVDVVVLDFDLSWYKGALDISVVHGARAQGYAAPEQTALGARKGISTRHTAVDVFGLGMLAFFLFTGEDPRPNEHNFSDFRRKMEKSLRDKFNPKWKCLEKYLARTVYECTKDVQAERLAFSSAVEAFGMCSKMIISDNITANHPLALFEIGSRLDPEGKFEVKEFGRNVKVVSIDGSKEVALSLRDDGGSIFISVSMSKVRS